jgi:uncharacterized protein DUF3592
VSASIRPFEGAPTLFPSGVRRRWPWPLRIVFGLLVALVALLYWRELEPLLLFLPVDGTVVYAEVEAVRVPGRHSGYTTRYVPTVTYSYVVRGETYTGAQYARTRMAGTRGRALRESRRFIRGARVKVWYNRFQPAEGVLSRAPNAVLITVLAVFVFMAWLFANAALATRK